MKVISDVTHYPPMFTSDDTEFSERVAFLAATTGFMAAFSMIVAGDFSEIVTTGT
jgi:hypothetical protein